MRGSVAAVVLASLLVWGLGPVRSEGPSIDHGEQVLIPPTNGTFLVGAFGDRLHGDDLDPSEDVTAATHHSWSTNTTDCHRRLFADLDWRPTSATGDPAAPIDVPYLFEIAIVANGTEHVLRVLEPREQIYIGQLPDDGNLTIHLVLRQGAAVDWTFGLVAREALYGCDGPLIIE